MFDGIKRWVRSFRQAGGLELPDAGRSSVETLDNQIVGMLASLGLKRVGEKP